MLSWFSDVKLWGCVPCKKQYWSCNYISFNIQYLRHITWIKISIKLHKHFFYSQTWGFGKTLFLRKYSVWKSLLQIIRNQPNINSSKSLVKLHMSNNHRVTLKSCNININLFFTWPVFFFWVNVFIPIVTIWHKQ